MNASMLTDILPTAGFVGNLLASNLQIVFIIVQFQFTIKVSIKPYLTLLFKFIHNLTHFKYKQRENGR
jgi:hypothetical protein